MSENPNSIQQGSPRGRALSIVVPIFAAATLIATIMNLKSSDTIAAALPGAPSWAAQGILMIGVLGLIGIVGLVGIWLLRKWGVYLYASVVVLSLTLNLLILGGLFPLFGLMGGSFVVYLAHRKWPHFT